MNKISNAILVVITFLPVFVHGRSSVLGDSLRHRRLETSPYRNTGAISTYSNVKGRDDSYTVGCMREIDGKRCGSKRVEGSPYCYNCKQIVNREFESRLEKSRNEYNKTMQEIDASRRQREQEKQRENNEINRLKTSTWNVYFETLQEQHDRMLKMKPAPQYPPDGFGE